MGGHIEPQVAPVETSPSALRDRGITAIRRPSYARDSGIYSGYKIMRYISILLSVLSEEAPLVVPEGVRVKLPRRPIAVSVIPLNKTAADGRTGRSMKRILVDAYAWQTDKTIPPRARFLHRKTLTPLAYLLKLSLP